MKSRQCKNCETKYFSNMRRSFCTESCGRDYFDKKNKAKKLLEIERVRKLSDKDFREYECNRVFRSYISSAESREIDFNLPYSYFEEIYDAICFYCGDKTNHIGIDRVDSKIGYQLGNVVPCCTNCNTMKMIKPKSMFIAQCMKIADHQRQNETNTKSNQQQHAIKNCCSFLHFLKELNLYPTPHSK